MSIYFVDPGEYEMTRVLCESHWKDLMPAARGVAVTDAEQKQSILIFKARIACEVCSGRTK